MSLTPFFQPLLIPKEPLPSQSYKGSLLFTRKLFKDYLVEGLIERIEPIGKPMNKSREVFYCLTKKGAKYIGRADEYKYKKYGKSPNRRSRSDSRSVKSEYESPSRTTEWYTPISFKARGIGGIASVK
jgi:hypothetical protein